MYLASTIYTQFFAPGIDLYMNVVYLCVNMLGLVGSGLYNYITNLAGQIDVSVAYICSHFDQ